MTIFRSSRCVELFAFFAIANLGIVAVASAQALPHPVNLDPLSSDGVNVVTVKNMYGKCGSAVVQVLGVKQEVSDFFSVDGNADVIVIGSGGRKQLSLRRYMSDYNGLACVGKFSRLLLLWSDCGGSACGHGYSFTVVDPRSLAIIAGGPKSCNARCASAATGTTLPIRLDAAN